VVAERVGGPDPSHTCPIGLRYSCVPIHFGDQFVGVAKLVVALVSNGGRPQARVVSPVVHRTRAYNLAHGKRAFRVRPVHTYKPVLDDQPFRAFDTTADYRRWCEDNLPDRLGYGRV